jgi:hypothetical protein
MEIGGMASPHWRKGLGLQPIFTTYYVSHTGTGGYVNNNNIHPKRLSSHWLQVDGIPSIKSSIMFRNVAQVIQLLEKKLTTPMAHFFYGNQDAFTCYIVHSTIWWICYILLS